MRAAQRRVEDRGQISHLTPYVKIREGVGRIMSELTLWPNLWYRLHLTDGYCAV